MTEHISKLADDNPDAERCGCGQVLYFSSTQLKVICTKCGRKYTQWSVMQQKFADEDSQRPKRGAIWQ